MISYFLLSLALFCIILAIHKSPDFWFWILLMLFFDPGGFFEGYFENKAITIFNFSDILIFGIIVSIIVVQKQTKVLMRDNDFKRIFYYLFIFQIYYVIIYGIIVPNYYSRLDFIFFLQKNRMYFMALPIMYGVYLFAKRSINIFIKILVYLSTTILTLYLITVLTHIPIVPTITMERYSGSGIERIAMLSYGLISFVFQIALITFLLKRRLKIYTKYDKTIYYCALLMLITLFLTLTRREYLNIALSVVTIIMLFSYIFKISKFKLSAKIGAPISLGFAMFFLLFPSSFNNTLDLFKDTFYIILTGQDTIGRTDYRISGTDDMVYVKQIISENPMFGTGYIPYTFADVVQLKGYGNTFAMAIDASAEVPIYGAFFRLGIIGVLLASGIYILLLKDLIKLSKKIKNHNALLINMSNVEKIFILLSLYYFISIFTYRIYAIFGDLSSPSTIPIFSMMLGLFYSLKNKMEVLSREY